VPDGGGFIQQLAVVTVRWVTQRWLEENSGLTIKAQRHKMDDGVWPEWTPVHGDGLWRKAPDGNRYVHLDNYYRWVEGK
jgi:hypothetical protein